MFYKIKYLFVFLLFSTCESTYPDDLRAVVSYGDDVYVGLHIYSENSEPIPIATTTIVLYNVLSFVDSLSYIDDFSDFLFELYSKKEAMLLVNENQYNKLLRYKVLGNSTYDKDVILSQINSNDILNEDYFNEDLKELLYYISRKEILIYRTGTGIAINKELIEELEK